MLLLCNRDLARRILAHKVCARFEHNANTGELSDVAEDVVNGLGVLVELLDIDLAASAQHIRRGIASTTLGKTLEVILAASALADVVVAVLINELQVRKPGRQGVFEELGCYTAITEQFIELFQRHVAEADFARKVEFVDFVELEFLNHVCSITRSRNPVNLSVIFSVAFSPLFTTLFFPLPFFSGLLAAEPVLWVVMFNVEFFGIIPFIVVLMSRNARHDVRFL
jgi:hypothetical protein